jgi:hypothetical protein
MDEVSEGSRPNLHDTENYAHAADNSRNERFPTLKTRECEIHRRRGNQPKRQSV